MSPCIVMYHNVLGRHPGIFQGFKGIPQDTFEQQMKWLTSVAEPLTHDHFLQASRGEGRLPDRGFYVTFDDGTKDHLDIALPVLKSLGITASFFPYTQPLTDGKVPTVDKQRFLQYGAYDAYTTFLRAFSETVAKLLPTVDASLVAPSPENLAAAESYLAEHDFYTVEERFFRWVRNDVLVPHQFASVIDAMFADYYADEGEFLRQFYLDFEDLKELQSAGMTIGGHSHSHPLLTRLSLAQVRIEVGSSLELLREGLGTAVNSLAYPFGNFSLAVRNLLPSLGIAYAFATGNRIAVSDDIFLALPRVDAASFEALRNEW